MWLGCFGILRIGPSLVLKTGLSKSAHEYMKKIGLLHY